MRTDKLAKYVATFKGDTVATIVIDNCSEDFHRGLAALVGTNSKAKIISLDFSLDTDELKAGSIVYYSMFPFIAQQMKHKLTTPAQE